MIRALLLYTLFLAFVVLLLTVIVGGLFLAGYLQRQKSETGREALEKTAENTMLDGKVTAVTQTRDESAHDVPVLYQLSVQYRTDNGGKQNAHFVFRTHAEQSFAVGQKTSLRRFAGPVLTPEERGSQKAGCTVFMGRPVDQTATLMLEPDYQAFLTESEETVSRCQKRSAVLFAVAGISALFAFSFFLNLFVS
ncbi:MAG: hypothetical protein J6Z45_01135 [Oscillospiraceae bacterium]|nr:hypothetical protein [Oscillospiraceae bacterium]